MERSIITPIYAHRGKPMSIAIFLSGSGTNFLAIYEEQKRLEKAGEKNYGRIDLVFTNVPNCKGAKLAEEYGIPVASVSSRKFFDLLEKHPDDDGAREYYDACVIVALEEHCIPDLIVLAGYRRRLSNLFLSRYKNKVVNLYPGDITKDYLIKGVEASVQAIRAKQPSIKCSVYLERENERFGALIIQSKPISLEGYSEADKESVNQKIREEGEWKIFPYAVHNLFAKGCLETDEDNNIYLEGVKLESDGLQFGG